MLTYSLKKAIIAAAMKKTHFGLGTITRSLLATSLIFGATLLPFTAKAQGTLKTVNFGGTVSQVWGTPGIPNGATVTGSITFNPSDFILYAGNGSTTVASDYSDPNAIINVSVNGVVTPTSQGTDLYVFNNGTDFFGNPADSFTFLWGPGDNDGVTINYPTSTIGNSSLASAWTMVDQGLNGSLTYQNDNVFNVGQDQYALNGAGGPLSSFSEVSSVPEPSLGISLAGTNLTFWWPTNATGCQLQSSSLLGNGANWAAVTNSPVIINTNYSVILPCTNASRFFCLQGTN